MSDQKNELREHFFVTMILSIAKF